MESTQVSEATRNEPAREGKTSGKGEKVEYLDPTEIVIIGLDTEDGEEHDLWDKRAKKPVDLPFVHDIIDQGILEPVIVRKNGATIECIAGRRRVKAARKGNEVLAERGSEDRIKVPCIRRAGDAKSLLKIIISENANREDLDPMEEARLVQRSIDRGFSLGEAAVAFGCNQQTIRNRVQLLNAAREVKQAVTSGTISPTAALKLAALEQEKQADALAEMIAAGDTRSSAAARAARKRKTKAKRKKGAASSETEYPVPGKRLLNKILAAETEAKEAIGLEAVKMLKYVLGLAPATSVKGLSPFLASLEDAAE